jgi:hypothetical protein
MDKTALTIRAEFLTIYEFQWRLTCEHYAGKPRYSVSWGWHSDNPGDSGWHDSPVTAIDAALAEMRRRKLEAQQ